MGYGQIHHNGKAVYAHRVAFEQQIGPIPNGYLVCHHCDNPSCCRGTHLFTGLDIDNIADMVAKRRHAAVTHPDRLPRGDDHHFSRHPELVLRGEKVGTAKLTAAQIIEIRARRKSGTSIHELSRSFSVSRPTIKRILAGAAWAHIE